MPAWPRSWRSWPAQLRWDVEDDLARWFGDIAAARLVGGARALSSGLRGAAARLGNNLVEYLSQERPILTPRSLMENWAADIARANAALDAAQARARTLRARLQRLQDGRVAERASHGGA